MPITNLQNSNDFEGQKFYVGLDVHKKSWSVTVRSLQRQVTHFTQPPCAETLARTLKKRFPGGIFYSAYEAGFCGTVAHEQLCKHGITNIIVNPGDVPSTDKQKKTKTDVHDSRLIAENLEKNNLRAIHIFTHEQQQLRSLCRLRECKVKERVRANNRLKGFLVYYGIQVPETISKKEFISQKVLTWLQDLELSCSAGNLALQEIIAELKHQRQQEYRVTKMLRQQVEATHGEEYKRLLTVPGIGPVTAMAMLAETGGLSRFDDPDEYASYLGLMPWDESSGDTIKTKGIQPRCNKHLRPLLIEAAWVSVRKSTELHAYYSKHAAKNNKHAIIKVAKKLAMIARGCVLKKEDYQAGYVPKKQEAKSEKVFQAYTEQHI